MSNGEYIGATQILRRISDFPEIQDLMDRMCERMLVAIEYRRNVGLMMGELAIFIRNVQDVFDDVRLDEIHEAWQQFQERCLQYGQNKRTTNITRILATSDGAMSSGKDSVVKQSPSLNSTTVNFTLYDTSAPIEKLLQKDMKLATLSHSSTIDIIDDIEVVYDSRNSGGTSEEEVSTMLSSPSEYSPSGNHPANVLSDSVTPEKLNILPSSNQEELPVPSSLKLFTAAESISPSISHLPSTCILPNGKTLDLTTLIKSKRPESLDSEYGEEACRQLIAAIGNYPVLYEIYLHQDTRLEDLPDEARQAFGQVTNTLQEVFTDMPEDLAYRRWRNLRRTYNTKNCSKKYAGRIDYLNKYLLRNNVPLLHPPRPWASTIITPAPPPVDIRQLKKKAKKRRIVVRHTTDSKKQRIDNTPEMFEAKYSAEALSALIDEIGHDKEFYSHCARKYPTPDTLNDRQRERWENIFLQFNKKFPNVNKQDALFTWRSIRRNYFNVAGHGGMFAGKIHYLNSMKESYSLDPLEQLMLEAAEESAPINPDRDDELLHNPQLSHGHEAADPCNVPIHVSEIDDKQVDSNYPSEAMSDATSRPPLQCSAPNQKRPLKNPLNGALAPAQTPRSKYRNHPLQKDPIRNLLKDIWKNLDKQPKPGERQDELITDPTAKPLRPRRQVSAPLRGSQEPAT